MAFSSAVETETRGAEFLGSHLSHSMEKPPASRRHREAIAGTVVVAVLIAGGRWISHISVGPVYISDVLLGAAFVHAATSWLVLGRRPGRARGPGLLVGLVLAATVIRLLMFQGEVLVAAHDAAPFAYISIAYLSAKAYTAAGECNRHRTLRLLYGALLVHFGWVALVLLAPGLTPTMPSLGNTSVLEIRSDFDTALLGVLSGLSIIRFRRTHGDWLAASVAGASLALALAMGSRAGLLACCACVLTSFVIRSGKNRRNAVRTVVLGAMASLLLLVLLPNSPSGQRLLGTVDSSATSRQFAASAQGTARARKMAWERVARYTLDDPVRSVIGVGFGPDFLRASRADVPLGGRSTGSLSSNRAPHNYLLTTFARLGLIGLTLIVTLLITIFGAAIRSLRTSDHTDELVPLCALLVTAIPIVAVFGVVLESPFGAIPYFWAGGILLAGDHRRRSGQMMRGEQAQLRSQTSRLSDSNACTCRDR